VRAWVSASTAPAPSAELGLLTARETDVLRLVGRGLISPGSTRR
jgi:DNA-binding CsgD family transcriptional regulator